MPLMAGHMLPGAGFWEWSRTVWRRLGAPCLLPLVARSLDWALVEDMIKKKTFPFQQLSYSETMKETNTTLTFLHGYISYCHFHPILCWRYIVTSSQQDPVHINDLQMTNTAVLPPQKILYFIWFVSWNRNSSFITFRNIYFSENKIYQNENLISFPGKCETVLKSGGLGEQSSVAPARGRKPEQLVSREWGVSSNGCCLVPDYGHGKKSWMIDRSAQVTFHSDLIVLCSLFLSCLVDMNRPLIDMQRTD